MAENFRKLQTFWVRVPKLRSLLVKFKWEGLRLYAFAMEKIKLPTLEEVFKRRLISDEYLKQEL